MALEAGSVFVRLGGLFTRDEFDKWDRATGSARTQASKPIDAKLGADTSGFQRDMAAARTELGVWGMQKADATVGIDTASVNREIGGLENKIHSLMQHPITLRTKADVKSAIANLDALQQRADRVQKEIKISASADTAEASKKIAELAVEMAKLREEADLVGHALGGGGGEGGGGRGGILGMGGGDGGGRIPPWLWRPGGPRIPGTRARIALGGFSLATVLGLGPEHAITAVGSVAGSGLGALGGAGIAATGALGRELTGGLADRLVTKTTLTEVENMAKAQQTLSSAVAQYGKNSTQAKAATAALQQEMQRFTPAAAAAQMQVAKNALSLQAFYDKVSGPARIQASHLFDQILKLARDYVPTIVHAAADNLSIINKSLRPFFLWLEGPQGMGIFKELELDFAKNLPTSIHAFTQAVEVILKVMVAASRDAGGFTEKIDKFFTRINREPPAQLQAWVDHFLGELHQWAELLGAIARAFTGLVHQSAGEGQTLVQMLTHVINKFDAWERSARGAHELHSFFKQRADELMAILHLFGALGGPTLKLVYNLYMALQPLVPVITAMANALGDVIKWLVDLGHQSPVIQDALVVPLGIFLLSWKKFGLETTAMKGKWLLFGGALDTVKGKLATVEGKLSSVVGWFKRLAGVEEEAAGAGKGIGSGVSKPGGIAGSAEGALFGLTGVRGAGIGSAENPLAVLVMDPNGGLSGGVPGALKKDAGALSTGETAVAAEAKGGTSLLSRLLPAGLVAGIGTLGSQLLGNVIGGKAGHTVSTIGTGASLGAAAGTAIAGPVGAAVGGAVGGGIATLIHFLGSSGPTWAERVGRAAAGGNKQLAAEMTRQLEDYRRRTSVPSTSPQAGGSRTAPRLGPGGLLFDAHTPPAVEHVQIVPTLQTEAGRKAIADARKVGDEAAAALIKGWSKFKFPSEGDMVSQLEHRIAKLPPYAQAQAVETAVAFARKLEKEGRLPAGSAQKMLDDIEKRFPQLTKYLGRSATDAVRAFTSNFNFRQAQRNLTNSLNHVEDDFQGARDAAKRAGGDISNQSDAIIRYLQNIVKHGTGPMKQQAEADIKDLQTKSGVYFTAMSKNANAQMAQLANGVTSGSKTAYDNATYIFDHLTNQINSAMHAGLLGTNKGSELIAQAINQQLKDFGAKPLPIASAIQWAHWQYNPPPAPISSGIGHRNANAQGGILPGAEYGLSDQMTLVDPMGMPRAIMAGDESVFTRHQMPYVDMGLRMLGFNGAEGLWNSVSRPHGYYKGGKLPAYDAGGYIFPWPAGTHTERVDQGWDASMPVGSPIGAIGKARIGPMFPTAWLGQPYMSWELLEGPMKGRWVFLAEQIRPDVHPGQLVNANQAVAHFAPSGTGIEMGWTTAGEARTGHTLATIQGGYHEGQQTAAGASFKAFLLGLQHGKIVGGGDGGFAPVWKDIKSPKVYNPGPQSSGLARLIQTGFDRSVAAGNRKGEQRTAAISTGLSGVGGVTGQFNGDVPRQVYQVLSKDGFSKIAIAGILGNAWQESGWNPGIEVGGNGGLWGFTSGAISLNSLKAFANNMNAPWTSPSVQAEFLAAHITASQRASLDAQKSPAAAASWFMTNWERPNASLANLSNRIAGANRAFSMGYRKGGRLPGFAGGGRLPRFATGGRLAGGVTAHYKLPKLPKHVNAKQPKTPPLVRYLKKLGADKILSGLQKDDKLFTQLEDQYTRQEDIFNLYDGGGGQLPEADLDALYGIRFKEWNILSGESTTVGDLLAKVNAKLGHDPDHPHSTTGSGIDPRDQRLHKELTHDEHEVKVMEHELLDAQYKRWHGANVGKGSPTQACWNAAGHWAAQIAAITDQLASDMQDLRRLHHEIIQIGIPEVALHGHHHLTPKERREKELYAIVERKTHRNAQLRGDLGRAWAGVHKAAGQYARQGWARAWPLMLQRFRIADKLDRLKMEIKNLQNTLKTLDKTKKDYTRVYTQLKDRLDGGGGSSGESITQMMGDVGLDILTLQQQGAAVPDDVVHSIDAILAKLGISIPSTGAQGSLSAAQAFAEFQAFQTSRASLFSGFGSNFAATGTDPFATTAGAAAGTQFFGDASGAAPGAAASAPPVAPPAGGTTVNVTQYFQGGPPDPHTYAAGLGFELQAQI